MQKKNIIPENNDYDIIYINPGFTEFPEILEHQKTGLKVLLVFQNDIIRDDYFQVTCTFPFQLINFPAKHKEFTTIQKAIKSVPHLFQQQKVFYPGNSKRQKNRAVTADFLYKNTFQQKVEVKTQNNKNNSLKQKFREGILFQEYKLNYSRFYVKILKYFQKLGGTIYGNKQYQISGNQVVISDKSFSSAKIKKCNLSQKNVLKIPVEISSGFVMTIQHKNRLFHFYENKNQLVAESTELVTPKELLEVAQHYFEFKPEKTLTGFVPQNISMQQLIPILDLFKDKLDCVFEETDFEELHELCLEKYDLAKQTGINYSDFKILFHRYGKGIDEMTENAYTQMNVIRDSKIIWKNVENEFQKKYEWRI